ncbi:TPR repeat protein [Cenarchaeum symbiosum A]|uniref:TPR repeat protein n=1 Tax=Cenarchaeum symbiosum (strain A) TaxID=414004 RepID=A0RUH6_CENSY|nr:TPR repeat protein [Cenarchaeum symbiosum A]
MKEAGESRPARAPPRPKKAGTDLTDSDYQRRKLHKKGVNLMADEKLDDAAEAFEQALRYDPENVDTLIKLGYAKFHLDDYTDALKVYDRILDIDVTNAETWNLKSLIHYEQKNYAKALDCVEKAIDSDPTYGMAWYNKGCYLSLLMQIPEAIESLKRSIEIDVKNARKSVKDRDFANVRAEDGFRRIVEVVVIESVRQGYHTIGAIVWTTFLSKADTEDALLKLLEKGLIVKGEKKEGLQRIPIYDLSPDIASRVGTEKRSLLGLRRKKLPAPVRNLKELGQTIQEIKAAIEDEDVDALIRSFDDLIDPKKFGEHMIGQFLEEHREIRLWKIRLKDHGVGFLQDNKKKMSAVFDNIETAVTKQLRSEIA